MRTGDTTKYNTPMFWFLSVRFENHYCKGYCLFHVLHTPAVAREAACSLGHSVLTVPLGTIDAPRIRLAANEVFQGRGPERGYLGPRGMEDPELHLNLKDG